MASRPAATLGEEASWEELWHPETRALFLAPLVTGDFDSYTRFRRALTRGQEARFAEHLSRSKACKAFSIVENGVLKSLKYMLNHAMQKPMMEIFEDKVLLRTSIPSSVLERTQAQGTPVFLHVFITTPSPCDLPLGLYCVKEYLAEPCNAWLLTRLSDEPVATEAPAEEACSVAGAEAPLEAPVEGHVATGQATAWHRPPRPAASATCLSVGGRLQSRRFSHDGDDFDSQLECIHREAFRRMGLQYFLTRSTFQVGQALRTRGQKMYTPDGILYAPFGAARAPLRLFHVEIKPGPLTLEESDLCYALCGTQQQCVLCLIGGYATEPTTSLSSGDCRAPDYSSLSRPRPFLEMCLYVPQGVGVAPLFYPSVAWRSCERRLAGYYLSPLEASDPLSREEERMRLARIYQLATKDAVRLSRGLQEQPF